MHHTHLGIESAGAQGVGASCGGMSAQKTREEGGRASNEMSEQCGSQCYIW